MQYITSNMEPRRVLQIFEDISAIPRGSGNESGVAKYIVEFAQRLGLEAFLDSTGNVFVRKNASLEYEDIAPVAIQGHMDMVCEKNGDCTHNFENDPLELFVEDGMLGAQGTTLGGDDGIAVAMMLALLEEENTPTLECLFTVEEETGLAGAKGFDCSNFTAKRMINLDSEDENTLTAGCAGGVRTEVSFAIAGCKNVECAHSVCLKIKGLAGGHSGAEIDKGRTNAIVLMGRLLNKIYQDVDFCLVSISGGGKDNAIARECEATVAFMGAYEARKIQAISDAFIKEINKELSKEDEGLSVECVVFEGRTEALTRSKTENILRFLSCVNTGVLKMSNAIPGLVEFSRNLGVVQTEENRIRFTLSSRSSLEHQIDFSCSQLDSLSALCDAKSAHYSRYPGWEFERNSKLREEYLETYESLFGKKPEVIVIHAGLECGILSSKTPGLDIISVGPNMKDIHTPQERLDIASCDRIWKTIKKLICDKKA